MVAGETSQINLVGDEIGVFFVAQCSGLPAVGFPEEMPGSFVELGMLIHAGWLSHPAQAWGTQLSCSPANQDGFSFI